MNVEPAPPTSKNIFPTVMFHMEAPGAVMGGGTEREELLIEPAT